MRLLRLVCTAAVIGGAAVFVKRLMEQQAQQAETPATAPSATADATPRAESPAPARSSSNGGEPTKAELYERAQELGIEGRSKMSKRELQRAIEAAGR